jgi:hypothetical protein
MFDLIVSTLAVLALVAVLLCAARRQRASARIPPTREAGQINWRALDTPTYLRRRREVGAQQSATSTHPSE